MRERKWWQEEVVYQIYPKSFYDSNGDGIGDIRGILEKLPYLEQLGVTMLWICPIFASPMDDNGYDISDYMELAPEFGAMADLEELIDAAKRRGIKIILDLVINHTSDEHAWFQEALRDTQSPFHDFYIFQEGRTVPNNWRSVFGGSVWEKVPGRDEYYFHSFGKKQPDLNWENPEVRRTLYGMVNGWLEKGIAGFRIDAITFIKKDLSFRSREADGADGLVKCTKTVRNQPGIGEFLRELNAETFQKHDCVTVAEAPGVAYEELGDFIGEGGYFSMIFDFRYADLDVASGSEWFKRIPWTIQELRDKIMASQMALQKVGWGANFIENHDQPRAATKYLREAEGNRDAVTMIAAMYFFLRGTPFIYQGQELGMTNFRRDNVSQFDDLSSIDQYYRSIQEGYGEMEALKFVNLRSRDNARTPFPWNGGCYGGFSETEPWLEMNGNYTEINAKAQMGEAGSVLEFYRRMIAFRQKGEYRDCLIYGSITPAESPCDVIAYERRDGDMRIFCCFNFSGEERKVCVPGAGGRKIFGNYETGAGKMAGGLFTPKDGGEKRDKVEGNVLLEAYEALLIKVEG